MQGQRRPGFRRAIRQCLTGMVLGVLALLAPVSAASAHDSLIGTNPTDGQTINDRPDIIDLMFSNMPLAIGTQVLVEDAGGKEWAVGGVKIVDHVVSQAVSPDAPGGEYTVIWRVVSSDGHPIEGKFGFTAKSGGADGSSSQAAGPEPDSDLSEGPESSAPVTFPLGPLLGSVAVLLALAAIIMWAVRRRANKKRSV